MCIPGIPVTGRWALAQRWRSSGTTSQTLTKNCANSGLICCTWIYSARAWEQTEAIHEHWIHWRWALSLKFTFSTRVEGGGPRVVVSIAALHARVRGSVPGLGGLKETKTVSPPSTCKSQYCGEPPWPRGSVLGLRPPGLEFRILCLEDSVMSIISPSSGGSPGAV